MHALHAHKATTANGDCHVRCHMVRFDCRSRDRNHLWPEEVSTEAYREYVTWDQMGLNFDLHLARSSCTRFDASRREKHNSVWSTPLAFCVQLLFAKKTVCENRMFWTSWAVEPKLLMLVKKPAGLRYTRFPCRFFLALIVSNFDVNFQRKPHQICKMWSFMPYGELNIDLNEEMTDSVDIIYWWKSIFFVFLSL